MKKYLVMGVLAVMAVMAMSAVAAEPRYLVTTGSKTGTYFRVGLNLLDMVPGGAVLNSKGSVENMERLYKGEADIAIVQLDAYAWYSTKNPERASTFEVLGPLYQECAYIAVNCNGKIGDEDDLGKKGVTIGIGRQGSGMNVTWDYMRQLETSYQNAAVEYVGGSRALGKLASSPDSGLDAVLWVTKPNINGNKELQTVLKNDNLCLISINDASLNNVFKPLGKPVYVFEDVDIEKGFFSDTEVETICTDAVVIGRVDADSDLLDSVADAVLNYKATLLK